MSEQFQKTVQEGYSFEGDSILIGGGMVNEASVPETQVRVALKTLNRHGLIAGATGTGKTKSVQLLAESLSSKGVAVLLMDMKGDLSGIALEGAQHEKIDERHERIGSVHTPSGFPVEFLTLSDQPGDRLRATVSEFGPVLFSKILGLNDTQSGIISVVFKYSDDKKLPLLDLKDFKKLLQHMDGDAKDEVADNYGAIASASMGTILRKVVELESQGADKFFGETSFEVDDLIRKDINGKGIISMIRLTDIQDKPKLFSTFMLSLLAEIYATLPEEGDVGKPKLAIFIDEAHLIFDGASKELLDQIESIVRLIRSKGVGLFFVTQLPTDVPDEVLGQLGLKIQHALRAFTAKDRKKIKSAAENYPDSEFYDVAELLTSMGIGEAAVTVLNEQGIPTPIVHTLMCAPASRMGVLTEAELNEIVASSQIAAKYNEVVDRESAYEILNAKIEEAQSEAKQAELAETHVKAKAASPTKADLEVDNMEEPGMIQTALKSTAARQVGRTVARELTRGLLGAFGLRGRRR